MTTTTTAPVDGKKTSGSLFDFLQARGRVEDQRQASAFANQLHAMLTQLVCDEEEGFSVQAMVNLPRLSEHGHMLDVVAWMMRVNTWWDALYQHEREKIKSTVFVWQ